MEALSLNDDNLVGTLYLGGYKLIFVYRRLDVVPKDEDEDGTRKLSTVDDSRNTGMTLL
jgi:hypothetical protein